MRNQISIVLVLFRFFVYIQLSATQLERYAPPKWYFTYLNENCSANGTRTTCVDIRICKSAVASIAIGGWPAVCGFVTVDIPKVCCGFPLVLGDGLMRKVEEEKEKHTNCGRAVWAPKLSPTELDFNRLVKYLPDVNTSDQSIFHVPIGETTGYDEKPSIGYRYSLQGEFPWMVSIQEKGTHLCSGTLIDRIHVLTAAHCFRPINGTLDPKRFAIRTSDIMSDDANQVNVLDIVLHDTFLSGQYYRDIAILKLKEKVRPLNHPVCLSSPNFSAQDLTGANTTLLGWEDSLREENHLQSVEDIPVVSNKKCREFYGVMGRSHLPRGVTNDFICAGQEDGNRDACQSDSSGILMYKNTDYDFPVGVPTERWVLVGINTFGLRCGEPGFPGVYTRVSSYVPWILQTVRKQDERNYGIF